MTLTSQIAKHFRDVHTGGNWTVSNLSDNLADVTWQEATTQVHGLNTIATLVFHVNYFVGVTLKVLQGGPLEGNDELSFAHPPIHSEEDWRALVEKALAEAAAFAGLIEQMQEERLWENLAGEKYGNYYRNIHGIIEHTHYHLGQMAIIKKIVRQQVNAK
jgi:uncharacterized damage-inducible protein DinB